MKVVNYKQLTALTDQGGHDFVLYKTRWNAPCAVATMDDATEYQGKQSDGIYVYTDTDFDALHLTEITD